MSFVVHVASSIKQTPAAFDGFQSSSSSNSSCNRQMEYQSKGSREGVVSIGVRIDNFNFKLMDVSLIDNPFPSLV